MPDSFILVMGDVSIECGVAIEPAERDQDTHAIRLGKPQQQSGYFIEIPGGAWRTWEYVGQKIQSDLQLSVHVVPAYPPPKKERPYRHFVDFAHCPKAIQWNPKAKLWLSSGEKHVYRVKETKARQHASQWFYLSIKVQLKKPEIIERLKDCRSIIICDRDWGFRRTVAKNKLKNSLKKFLSQASSAAGTGRNNDSAPWIVLETTDPMDDNQGQLLNVIHESGLSSRTIILMSANSLKSSGLEMRDDLSLERAVEDLEKSICQSWSQKHESNLLARLARFRCVVIRLGSRAALIWEPTHRETQPPPAEGARIDDADQDRHVKPLKTQPTPAEGSQLNNIHLIYGHTAYEAHSSPAAESSDLGSVHGFSSILAAEIALELASPKLVEEESFLDRVSKGCASGLYSCQRYFTAGLGHSPEEIKNVFERLWRDSAEHQKQDSSRFHRIAGGDAGSAPGDWSILRTTRTSFEVQNQGTAVEIKNERSSSDRDIAVDVVRRGLCVLRESGIPFVEHVDLATADRHEIENYAGIANLITKYMNDAKWRKPLCLGVFGPPGCGKSFGIDQVVQAISGYKPSIPLSRKTFNLSQFKSEDQLGRAFHQIRNDGLAGTLPLVFVDEFDSGFEAREYGWLKYLLAPMQDGKFLDGDEWFHLPRCILVFIGGQNRDYREFENRLRDERFIEAKGRDFISRLRHFLVVKGPDLPGPGDGQLEKNEAGGDDPKPNPGRRLRRAMLLRSVLERNLPVVIETERENGGRIVKRANVDERVIEAFLSIEGYKHGVRSLEAIVDMSRASVTRRSFQRSSLPPEEQLDLHVNAREFLAIVDQCQPTDNHRLC